MGVRAVAVLALSCAFCAASCVRSPEPTTEAESDTAQPAGPLDEAAPTAEPTGEAAQDWTRADCLRAWQHNGELCNSAPPNVRMACFAAVAAMLTACLAGAQG